MDVRVWPERKLSTEELMFSTVVLEKTLENPLDCKEIKPLNPKGKQPWIFLGRTDAKAEAPILWPPDVKSRLIRKDPDAGKDWGEEKKGDRGWEGWIINSMDANLSKLQETVKDREAWHAADHAATKSWHDWVTEPQQQSILNNYPILTCSLQIYG